jgi:thiosulfate dehydrogenase (quinone)
MSTLTFGGRAAASDEAAQRGKSDTLRVAALALHSIRFIQGFKKLRVQTGACLERPD